MNFSKLCFSLLFPIVFLNGCGDSNRLEVNGDPAAIKLAQSMLDVLGGKSKWNRLKSVYVRTLNVSTGQLDNFILEEWIELDAPKMMNRQSFQMNSIIQILDGNDGWLIKNNNVELLPSQTITDMLKWHEHYMMRSLQCLAEGGENREVRIHGEKRIDFYENKKFIGGFELNTNNVIVSYFSEESNDPHGTIIFTEWGEYKGMKYPLEVRSSSGLSLFKTDYWDPREISVEKAFNISLNPNVAAEKFK